MIRNDKGFTLVSLLAMMTIMGIAMATIAPTWRYLVIRDREEELIFRGEQYQRAISLYQKKFNALPTKLEDLFKQRCIRQLFKDPMTGRGFELIYSAAGGNIRASRLSVNEQRRLAEGDAPGGSSLPIIGVVSTSKDKAIRMWKDKEFYNEWEFISGEEDEGRTQQPGEGGPDDTGDDDEEEEGDFGF